MKEGYGKSSYSEIKDPLSGEFVHIDFRHIRMDQELEAEIALTFIGESSAVKGLGGIFVKVLNLFL